MYIITTENSIRSFELCYLYSIINRSKWLYHYQSTISKINVINLKRKPKQINKCYLLNIIPSFIYTATNKEDYRK